MRVRNVAKQELVKAEAIKMLVRDGFNGFSMNKLAKACGLSVATLYIYYQDKDDLIKQIGSEISRKLIATTFRDFSPQMPFAAGLRKQWQNRTHFALTYPDEMACHTIIRVSPHGDEILQETYVTFKETLSEFVHGAVARNELITTTPEIFWSMAYGPLYTLLRFHGEKQGLGGRDFQLTDEALEEALQLVLKALTP